MADSETPEEPQPRVSDARTVPPSIPRVPTGVPGLDVLLMGGLLQGGIYMVLGTPGAGKTILGNQICYTHVAGGGRAIYVTLVAESHSRMLAHMRELSFFSQDIVGDTLHYISAYSIYDREGFPGLLKMLRRLVIDHKASILVLDGMSLGQPIDELGFKRFINELQVSFEASGCTGLILSPHALNDRNASAASQTMADGLIVMTDESVGARAVRQVEIAKFRGSGQLRGKHTFEISGDGIYVYPRTETLVYEAETSDSMLEERTEASGEIERKTFGIARFDQMMGGGIPSGNATMLLGVSGSGKTILGIHFLAEGARLGEHTLYYGFSETPALLPEKAEGVGLNSFREYKQQGLIHMLWQPALSSNLDAHAEQIIELVRANGIKRVFLDSYNGFVQTSLYPERIASFMTALLFALQDAGATTVIAVETPDLISSEIVMPIPELTVGIDNIVLLRYVEMHAQIYRLISVLKMRYSTHDRGIHEFQISKDGIAVASTFETAEAILSGVARDRG